MIIILVVFNIKYATVLPAILNIANSFCRILNFTERLFFFFL